MGIFDLPAPLFTALDNLISAVPDYPRLLVWGTLTAIISMVLYWVCSAQDKVAAAKQQAIAARKKMAGYDGTEFDEMLPLAKESLVASGRHFGIVLWPAVLSSLPAVAIIVWVSGQFGYLLPEPGTELITYTHPALPLTGLAQSGGATENRYTLSYPQAGETRDIVAANGELLTTLPLTAAVPVVHKRLWWNSLIGNPNGYLPDEYATEAIYFELSSPEHLSWGPGWVRGWEFSYFMLLIIISLGIKFAFRIH
jgi:hypothetical protein